MPAQQPLETAPGGDVALLVDWENLKFSLLQRGRRPNVTALRDAAERFGRVVYARAYADWQDGSHAGDPANLYLAGLEPVYVLTKRYRDGADERIKNSVDIKLAADCIEASHAYPNVGTYIIVTGDHGFIHVVNTLRPRGKRVVVIGVSWTTAAQLTEQADVVLYYDIDVERVLEDSADSASPASPAPAVAARPPAKLAPASAQMAESAMTLLKAEGATQDLDQRKIGEMLDLILVITREFRKDRRELSVSVLGQELQKRMNAADFQRHGRGRARPLAQTLAANGKLKLISRAFVDWLYLPDEPDEMIAAEAPRAPEPAHYSFAGFIYADLPPERREQVIVAIHNERHRPGTDFLNFNRVRDAVGRVVNRDEDSVKNLVNNMVDLGILRIDADRFGRDPDTGASYSFKTFSLDLQNGDVRRALKLSL